MDGLSIDEHLKILGNNTVALRYRAIHEHVQLTLDTLDTQKVSYAFKSWQIREKCLSVFKQALESYNPTICSIGLQGIEHVVLYPDLDGVAGDEDLDAMDSRIFVLQVLDALNHLPSLSADQQVHGLKILLGLCCDFVSSFDGELIIKIVQMCLACWHKDKINVHSATLQLCAAYTLHTQKLCSASCSSDNVDFGVHCAAESLSSQAIEKLANADLNGTKDKLADVIGLAKFFVQQINRAASDSQRALYLECLLAVLKTLESSCVRTSLMFCGYVSRDLCPALASVISLHTISTKVRILYSKKKPKNKEKTKKKKIKNKNVTRSIMLHRKVSLLSVELVRLVGCVASLRPHIALVFTHLLSPSTCAKHGVPFVIMNKLWSTPELLYDLAGPFLIQDVKVKQNHAGILQLIVDAMLTLCGNDMEGNVGSQINNIQLAVNGIIALLNTLDMARKGIGLRDEQVEHYLNNQHDNTTHHLTDEDLSDDDNKGVTNGDESLNDVEHDSDLSGSKKSDDEQEVDLPGNTKNGTADEVDDREYMSEDDEDVWASSEDLYSSLSSPCYLSAAEDEEELHNKRQNNTSKLFDLMQYISNTSRSVYANNTEDDDDVDASSSSTCTASNSNDTQEVDSDGDITKYIEDVIMPEQEAIITANKLVDTAEDERNCILAQRHVQAIIKILPQLLACDNMGGIDQAMQMCASNFCSDMYEKWNVDKLKVQADSLYALSYSMLLLCLRLKLCGHYKGGGTQLPCVKSQWVALQQSSGVYLSRSWLSETFRQVIVTDLLEQVDLDGIQSDDAPQLIRILGELDGLGHNMTHSNEAKSHDAGAEESSPAIHAGCEFSRQISVSVWCEVLEVLQYPIKNIHSSDGGLSTSLFLIFSPSSLRERSDRDRDCITSSLDGLRSAVKLSCSLGLHTYSVSVLSLMVEACVPRNYNHTLTDQAGGNGDGEFQLHICHVLCMDVILDVALQVASFSSKCWEPLFRVVGYVAYLDHICFHDMSSKFQSKSNFQETTSLQKVDIATLVKENKVDVSWVTLSSGMAQSTSLGFLTHARTVKAVYALSRNVDQLFEKAALQLNFRTLMEFIWSLSFSSNHQLFSLKANKGQSVYSTPLLYRLGECLLRCIRSSNRSLLHIAGVWQCASPHFAKVTGHKNLHIAKQAATYIHDVLTSVLACSEETDNHPMALWSDQEPKYFHFNEALLRPFERAMQAESCATEVQDLIISSISQLVETSSKQICSGWRPLFSTLKHVSMYNQHKMERSPVYDVLNAFFIASSSSSVFASAAYECIKCLLKMLSSLQDDNSNAISHPIPAIRYLEETADLLTHLHQSGSTEIFPSSHHIDVAPACSGDGALWDKLTSPKWCENESKTIEQVVNELSSVTDKCFSITDNSKSDNSIAMLPHGLSDKTGLLHTWFALMDGLTTSVLTSAQHIQPVVLNLLCKLLEKSSKTPGPSFCCHILLHSCLPTLHTWEDRLVHAEGDSVHDQNALLLNYKHMYGTIMELTADVIRRYLQTVARNETSEEKSVDSKHFHVQIEKTWTAYLNMCVSCIQTRKEPIAKLGCSCLRHIIATVGKHMTTSMIDDVCSCVNYLVGDSLTKIEALTSLYEQNPNSPDELIVEIKDKESAFCDSSSLTRVFQSTSFQHIQKETAHQEIYIICHPPPHKPHTRISLHELACDVSSLHLLLKCIEHMLLGDTQSPWQHDKQTAGSYQRNNNHDQTASETSSLHSTSCNGGLHGENSHSDPPLPLILDYLSTEQVHELCTCVARSFIVARNFDSHHALQRLVQKLAKFYNAANLYQFSALAYDIYLRIILSVCCQSMPNHEQPLSAKDFPATASSSAPLQVRDLLPSYKENKMNLNLDNDTSGDALKPHVDIHNDRSWAYISLHMGLNLVCRACDDVDACSSVESSSHEAFLLADDEKTDHCGEEVDESEAFSDENKDEKPKQNDINFDYMAYVKRTSLTDKASTKTTQNQTTEQASNSWSGMRVYKVAGDKTIGRLISAYKRHKQQQGATTVVLQNQRDIRDVDDRSASSGRSRTTSESSLSHSMVAMDDKTLEREVWASVVGSTLRLLTSAPDDALTRLLPVVYRPLASLANQRASLVPQDGGSDIGDAFHKWLLRVGDFCDILSPTKETS